MTTTKTFKFRLAGLSITAPSTWHKPPLLKRLMYPSQPELFGPGGPGYEFLWFDKPLIIEKPPSDSKMEDHLEASIEVRGNRILSKGEIIINGEKFPTITFEKHRHQYAPTKMKRYCFILKNKFITIGARLSHNNIECYSEEGYDEIVRSIKKA